MLGFRALGDAPLAANGVSAAPAPPPEPLASTDFIRDIAPLLQQIHVYAPLPSAPELSTAYAKGVNLLPATGEFVYDPLPYQARQSSESVFSTINQVAGAGQDTDYELAIADLAAKLPACKTVALICAWFGNSTDVTLCKIYPSTIYIGGAFQTNGLADNWRCSSLTEGSTATLIPISQSGGHFSYSGTPSDQSIVRCILDLKARGYQVVFYPFILMDSTGFPWRGRITYTGSDVTAAATTAINNWFGSAASSNFTRDTAKKTVSYSGAANDFTYRRMILHYANLVVMAGGVDLFLLGSELRGLEIIRGPAWTKAGTVDGSGKAIWDYPFVAAMKTLAADVRGIFDAAGLARDLTNFRNLITYSADWSSYNGWAHVGEDGKWPHLDQLWADASIDLVAMDNYMPLSDWTSGTGGRDFTVWTVAKPTAWPPAPSNIDGLGLTGPPSVYSQPYLQANIEGGEQFNWFYANEVNAGRGADPNGGPLTVSLPQGDRLTQSRQQYAVNQQLLAQKHFRWWWNNPHKAVYNTGAGQVPQGPDTQWVANSKSISFVEYGFPAVDKGANQPNVFYDPGSSESFTPYWSAWVPQGAGFVPLRDDFMQYNALKAFYDYWFGTANQNVTVNGVPMIQARFCNVWTWDARPFPAFPISTVVWADAENYSAGHWVEGRTLPQPVAPPARIREQTFLRKSRVDAPILRK